MTVIRLGKCEEDFEIMVQDPGVPLLENPMECFGEEVREGYCPKVERKEDIYIELSIPL